jgi:DNA-binding beta-propeller fold protein YncE
MHPVFHSCFGLLLALPVTVIAQQAAAPRLKATVTTLAGTDHEKGSTDATGAAARFKWPMGLTLQADGVLYVSDTYNHTLRRISPTGEVTTFAGIAGVAGSGNGPAAIAQFRAPVGLAVDGQGTVYVADTGNHTIRKVTAAGVVTTLAGQAGRKGSRDGSGEAARFNLPHGIAVAANGLVYVADTGNHTIRCITPTGIVTTVAGLAGQKGAVDGLGAAARFKHPAGLAVDATGSLYITDNGNYTLRYLSVTGVVTTLAGQAGQKGSTDGARASARFNTLNGVAVDAQGQVYVADFINSTIRQITPAGEVSTLAGTARGWGHRDGVGAEARFEFPFGVAVTPDGMAIYVADTQSLTVRVIH